MSKEMIKDKEFPLFNYIGRIGDFLQRNVYDRVSAISMGIPNISPPKGFTGQGTNLEYDILLESTQRILNQSGQEIYLFLKETFPDIDSQENTKLKSELSNIGTLGNIFINNRPEAANAVLETCKKMVEAYRKRNSKEGFIDEVRELKNQIAQFSTLGGLKRYLQELNKGFDT